MHIDQAQIARALTYEALIPVLKRALIAFSSGRTVQPLRATLQAPAGSLLVMPAIYGGAMGAKLVSMYPANAARGLPTHASVLILFSSETGMPLATFDAGLITTMRTAAVSAIAAELLAPADTNVLAILGSGHQARAHAEALQYAHNFSRINIWSRTPEHAASLAEAVGGHATTLEEAVRDADVIVTATSATQPILPGNLLKTQSLVISVGAVGPTHRELDDQAMAGALIVESRQPAEVESGDVILSKSEVYAELGELLNATKPRPRDSRIIFKSVGIAIEDIATAAHVFQILNATASAATRPSALQ